MGFIKPLITGGSPWLMHSSCSFFIQWLGYSDPKREWPQGLGSKCQISQPTGLRLSAKDPCFSILAELRHFLTSYSQNWMKEAGIREIRRKLKWFPDFLSVFSLHPSLSNSQPPYHGLWSSWSSRHLSQTMCWQRSTGPALWILRTESSAGLSQLIVDLRWFSQKSHILRRNMQRHQGYGKIALRTWEIMINLGNWGGVPEFETTPHGSPL